jgi:hypothetical protein
MSVLARPRWSFQALLRLLLPLLALVLTVLSSAAFAGPKPASGQFLPTGPHAGVFAPQNSTLHQGVWQTTVPPPSGVTIQPNTGTVLDWSLTNGQGISADQHVIDAHGNLNLQKPNQGVFYGNPVDTTNNAWDIVQQQGIQPTVVNGGDMYVVPYPNAGYAGGYAGQVQNLNSVTIITLPGTNKVITAYPGNGLPLPKAPTP